MTVNDINKATKQKVDSLMLPIVKYFEDNKELTYSELSEKWEEFKNELNLMRFQVVCDILTENGIENPFKQNTDNTIKSLVVQFSPISFDDNVNEYYYTKIKPIIVQKVNP